MDKKFMLDNKALRINAKHYIGKDIYSISTEWKIPTMLDMLVLYKNLEIDYNNNLVELGSYLMDTFMLSWDLKDNYGNSIPCNKKYKDDLPYQVSLQLISSFRNYLMENIDPSPAVPKCRIDTIKDIVSEMDRL